MGNERVQTDPVLLAGADGPLTDFEIFSTCPQSKDVERGDYVDRVAEVARASEAAGHKGILVYTDNSIVDAWLVSQLILQSTERLCPLVAVQPMYMHPYTAAKLIASLGFMHGRQLYLNILAGGFKNDHEALGDHLAHDDRYARAVEYTLVIRALLTSTSPVRFDGEYYQVSNLILHPSLPPELFPGLLISGSSPAGLAAAEAIGATPVRYPLPPEDDGEHTMFSGGAGIRVGVIARETADEAWRVAHERFPADRRGQIAHALAMRTSDSHWHRQLSELPTASEQPVSTYWLEPFKNGKTFCPYLVGDYQAVGVELARYRAQGNTVFILDIPPSRAELEHTATAFRAASLLASSEG